MIDLCIWDHMLIFAIGVILPALALWRGKNEQSLPLFSTQEKVQLYYTNSFILLLAAGMILLVWWYCGRSFQQLGFEFLQPDKYALGIAAGILLLYMIDVTVEVGIPSRLEKTRRRWRERTPFMPATRREFVHFLFLAGSAAVAEEIIFRGYFITYILSYLGESLNAQIIAIAVPAVVFAIVHLYQGRYAIVKILLLALPMGLIFLISRSLLLLILLHFVIDVLGGLAGMYLIPATAVDESESETYQSE